MDIELIALDVDGTLFTSKGQVPEEVEQAIALAHQKGLLVTMISGRSRQSLEPLAERFNIRIPYVGANGAFACLPGQKEPLFTIPLEPNDVLEVVNTVLCYEGVGIIFHYVDQLYFDPVGYSLTKSWRPRGSARYIKMELLDMLEKLPPPLKLELVGEERKISELVEKVSREHLVAAIVTGSTFLEINTAEANKGAGLAFLADYLHIPLVRTAACGDAMNDVGMLSNAGCSFAMGNAHPHIKKIAKYIAPTNEEAGTAWAIKKMLGMV